MNIAYFTDTYLPQINGVVTSIEIFRQHLEEKGHKVYIFCPKTEEVDQKLKDPAYVFRFKSTKFLWHPEYRLSWPYSRQLNKFNKLDIDIIHSHTPFSMGLLAVFIAKTKKLPLVHTYHTLFSEYVHYVPIPHDYVKNFAVWASKSYCNKNNLVIVPSNSIKEELLKYKVKSPIEVLPTGIDITEVDKVATNQLNKKFKIDDSLQYLVTVSRLGKEKNVDFLLKVFAKILESRPSTRLIIIGDGPYRNELEEQADNLNILEKIIFTGYIKRNDIFPLLKRSKVFVFASKTETQGLVLLEAMSMKLPCVAIDSRGVSDALDNNKGGTLCPDEVDPFAQEVLKYLSDKAYMQKKREEAYARAISMSAEIMTEKLLVLYVKLLAK